MTNKRRLSRGHPLALLALIAGACAEEQPPDIGLRIEPSICGDTTADWQDVELYDGTLGATIAFVDAHEAPVGRYYAGGFCSGTLISNDLFLTAAHCINSATVGGTVELNYQLDGNGNARTPDAYEILEVIEDNEGGLDYAIVRLEGDPGATWGISVPSALPISSGQPITIIQHPGGIRKVTESGTLSYTLSGRVAYDNLDTGGGSSGSGVLQNATGFVVGVHTSGTLSPPCGPSDPNTGEAMVDVYDESPTIRRLAIDPAKVLALL